MISKKDGSFMLLSERLFIFYILLFLLFVVGVEEISVNCMPGGEWDNDYIPDCQGYIHND